MLNPQNRPVYYKSLRIRQRKREMRRKLSRKGMQSSKPVLSKDKRSWKIRGSSSKSSRPKPYKSKTT